MVRKIIISDLSARLLQEPGVLKERTKNYTLKEEFYLL
jgi:hypothetical protein